MWRKGSSVKILVFEIVKGEVEVKRIKASASLLAHNQITAPQFIRRRLHAS